MHGHTYLYIHRMILSFLLFTESRGTMSKAYAISPDDIAFHRPTLEFHCYFSTHSGNLMRS